MDYLKNIVIAFCFGVGGAFAQESFTEQIVVPLSDPSKRGSVEIDVVNGSIEIKGYEGKEVIVKAQSGTPQDEHSHSHHNEDRNDDENLKKSVGLKRINSNPIEIEVTERNNRVSVESNSWKGPINFMVQVPVNFDLQLSTVNSGDIFVEGVNGNLELNNVNGKVVAHKISGSAIIDTVNGKIEASFNSVKADSPMAFSTLNGDLDVTLPPSTKATFKMKSDQGDIYTDFDMDVDNSGPRINRSNKGNFKVTIENWVYGKVNGGGPEFLFSNMNGNIYIRKK